MGTITFWLSLGMIFVIPWENVVTIEGVGTASKAAGILVAVLWVASVIITGRIRKPHPFHVVVFLFVLWNAVSVVWSVSIDDTLVRARTYFQLSVMLYMIWDLYRAPAAVRAGLQAYVLGGCVATGSMIANFIEGVGYGGTERFSATGFNPNGLALVLALGIPVAWHLAVSEAQGRKAVSAMLGVVNYAYVPAAFFAILLTASRGAVLASLPTLVFIVGSLTNLKVHLRVLLFGVLVGSLLAGLTVVPESSFQRLATTGKTISEGHLGGREHIWPEAIVVFSQHPFLGVGSAAFEDANDTKGSSHNAILSLLTELGIVGFSLFAALLAMPVYQARYLPKRSSSLWLTILIVWVIGNMSHDMLYTKQTWLFLSLAVVNTSLFVRHDGSRLRTGAV